jgi:hypothetical protein
MSEESREMREIMYGKEFVKKETEVENKIEELNKKHKDVLKDKKSIVTNKAPAHLKEYIIFSYDSGSGHTQFGIKDTNNDLPANVKQEIADVYCEAFDLKKSV